MADKVEKHCKLHGNTEHLLTSAGSGRPKTYRCITCRNEMRNKARQRLKLKAIEYKGKQCNLCGYNRCVEALEFHHIDPKIKSFEISERRNWNDVALELNKCLLLCANCHREIHTQNRTVEVSYGNRS